MGGCLPIERFTDQAVFKVKDHFRSGVLVVKDRNLNSTAIDSGLITNQNVIPFSFP
jgi:hypothetical protein